MLSQHCCRLGFKALSSCTSQKLQLSFCTNCRDNPKLYIKEIRLTHDAEVHQLTIPPSKKDFLLFSDHLWTRPLKTLLYPDASFPPHQPIKAPVYSISTNRGASTAVELALFFRKTNLSSQLSFLSKSSKVSYPNGPHVNFALLGDIKSQRPHDLGNHYQIL